MGMQVHTHVGIPLIITCAIHWRIVHRHCVVRASSIGVSSSSSPCRALCVNVVMTPYGHWPAASQWWCCVHPCHVSCIDMSCIVVVVVMRRVSLHGGGHVVNVVSLWHWPCTSCHHRHCIVCWHGVIIVRCVSTCRQCRGRCRCCMVAVATSLCGGGHIINIVLSWHWPCTSCCHCHCHRCVVVATSLSLSLLLRGGGHVTVAVAVAFIMAVWWQWPRCCCCLHCHGTGHARLIVTLTSHRRHDAVALTICITLPSL